MLSAENKNEFEFLHVIFSKAGIAYIPQMKILELNIQVSRGKIFNLLEKVKVMIILFDSLN